jgi:Large polyvalent protein-associated domain 7
MFERNMLTLDEPESNWVRKALAKRPPVIEDPASIWSLYHVEQGWRRRYYYADERKTRLVLIATHDAIKARRHDTETVAALLSLAEARGWKAVRVRGSHEFRRETWIEAHVKGNVAVTGYWETSADWREVARRRSQAQENNSAEPVAATPNRSAAIADLADRIGRLETAASAQAQAAPLSASAERELQALRDKVARVETVLTQAERDSGRSRASSDPAQDRLAVQRAEAAQAAARTPTASL